MALTAAPPLPRRGGSYEKDHIGNIDRQDEQDKQDEKLLHGKLTFREKPVGDKQSCPSCPSMLIRKMDKQERRLQNAAAGFLPGMATKGTKTQKERNEIKNSFCDFCAFCGEPAFLTRSHPILKKAEHHVCRQNDLPRCEFCKKLRINRVRSCCTGS